MTYKNNNQSPVGPSNFEGQAFLTLCQMLSKLVKGDPNFRCCVAECSMVHLLGINSIKFTCKKCSFIIQHAHTRIRAMWQIYIMGKTKGLLRRGKSYFWRSLTLQIVVSPWGNLATEWEPPGIFCSTGSIHPGTVSPWSRASGRCLTVERGFREKSHYLDSFTISWGNSMRGRWC